MCAAGARTLLPPPQTRTAAERCESTHNNKSVRSASATLQGWRGDPPQFEAHLPRLVLGQQ